MEFCSYCVVSQDYYSFCICSIDNGMCPYTHRCSQERRWKPLDMNKCCKRKEAVQMPEGSNKVRFCKNNILFVEVENYVVEIKNIYDNIPDYVYLVKKNGEWVLRDSIAKEQPATKTTKKKNK